jgi:hypothetical protein
VEEPLVILVKLADRLHNLRTVYALPPAKQQAVAEETLAVWCSMAASLGWHRLKVCCVWPRWQHCLMAHRPCRSLPSLTQCIGHTCCLSPQSEMEDLCFAVTDTSGYCSLRQELDKLWSSPPPPRSRRRVKATRRQLQLQQFSEQQQQLAAERAHRWGHGLLMGLQQRLRAPWARQQQQQHAAAQGTDAAAAAVATTAAAASSSSSSSDAHHEPAAAATQLSSSQPQQQSQGLNLLLRSLWRAGPAAADQGLLPAPATADELQLNEQQLADSTVASPVDVKRPCGSDWGVTDAALSLRALLHRSATSVAAPALPPAASAAPASLVPQLLPAALGAPAASAAAAAAAAGGLTPQQVQLRNILSTVVPFDAVSLTSPNAGLTWSAQQGLRVLEEAASRLYIELAVGSFSGGLKVEIQGRLKSVRSVANKMERKACSVEVRLPWLWWT